MSSGVVMVSVSCADGLSHSWHFFTRIFHFRQCKKCSCVEVRRIGRQGAAWEPAPNTMPF